MDLDKLLTEMRQERHRIDEAIVTLERLSASKGMKRRGRPPNWLKEKLAKEQGQVIDSVEEED